MIRQKLLQLRQQQNPKHMQRGALLMRGRLFAWLNSYRQADETLHIAAYWPLEYEPDLTPLLRQWAEQDGLQISLPCIEQADSPLVFRPWHPDSPMRNAAFGTLEPATTAVAPSPDIILVPTLGYTPQGDRMGYGRGYYDRTLAQLHTQNHQAVTIGIAWAVGDLSPYDYTPANHDQPLDAVLTDAGWVKAVQSST